MKQKLLTKRKKQESTNEMHAADAKPCKKQSVIVKHKKKPKQIKLKTEKLNNICKEVNKQMAREEHTSEALNDVNDIDLARDVARRTSTYVNSLSKAEQQEFESLRKWAQGYDVSLHKDNSFSKQTKCKQSEQKEQNVKRNRMNKNKYAETSEWEENSRSSESSSEPSWLSESDDNLDEDEEVEETDDDDEEGNESEGDVATCTNVVKGGIFRSNDDIWND